MIDHIQYERKILDERKMPSSYIINTINNAAEDDRRGELILAILISLKDKTWNDVHPEHLKILLKALKNAKLDDLFKNLIIEIFAESKII